jgi:hypothetical protein
MAEINLTGKHYGFGHTNRKDACGYVPDDHFSLPLCFRDL